MLWPSLPRFIATSRLVLLLALGAPLWVIPVFVPMMGLIPLLYLMALAAVLVFEGATLPAQQLVSASRNYAKRFTLGREYGLTLTIAHQHSQTLRLQIHENLPPAFDVLETLPAFYVGPARTATVSYRVVCRIRGIHELGYIKVAASHRWHLIQRVYRFEPDDTARIYPDLRDIGQYELLAMLDNQQDQQQLRLKRAAGRDFESLRPYLRGDDLRFIHWKASSKRGQLISKNFQIEQGQRLSILIDTGRFMEEAVEGVPRLEYAIRAAVLLAYVAQVRGDTVSVACFSNRVESIMAPTRGQKILPLVLDTLCDVQARRYESDYWQVIAGLLAGLNKRSLIIIFTDVIDLAGSTGLLNNLIQAASKHLVLCVVFNDRELEGLLQEEPQAEKGLYNQAAASYINANRKHVFESMRARGIMVLEAYPEKLTNLLINQYLQIRRESLQ